MTTRCRAQDRPPTPPNTAQGLGRPSDAKKPRSTTPEAGFITEAQWLATVLDAFRLLGWSTYHVHDSRRSAPGFPDVVAVHPGQGRILYCELKRVGGKLTHDQTTWLARLAAAGAEVYLWTPDDWETALAAMRGERCWSTGERVTAATGAARPRPRRRPTTTSTGAAT